MSILGLLLIWSRICGDTFFFLVDVLANLLHLVFDEGQ